MKSTLASVLAAASLFVTLTSAQAQEGSPWCADLSPELIQKAKAGFACRTSANYLFTKAADAKLSWLDPEGFVWGDLSSDSLTLPEVLDFEKKADGTLDYSKPIQKACPTGTHLVDRADVSRLRRFLQSDAKDYLAEKALKDLENLSLLNLDAEWMNPGNEAYLESSSVGLCGFTDEKDIVEGYDFCLLTKGQDRLSTVKAKYRCVGRN